MSSQGAKPEFCKTQGCGEFTVYLDDRGYCNKCAVWASGGSSPTVSVSTASANVTAVDMMVELRALIDSMRPSAQDTLQALHKRGYSIVPTPTN